MRENASAAAVTPPDQPIRNSIGDKGYLYSEAEDRRIAGLLVAQLAQRALGASGEPRLGDAEARAVARAAGLSDAQIDRVTAAISLTQVAQNLIDLFSAGPLPETVMTRFADAHLGLAAGDHLLDAGCSTGRFLVRLADRGAALSGVDISGLSLEIARAAWRQRQGDPQPGWQLASLVDLPMADASYSHVTSFVVLTQVPIRPALAEIRRVLRPGGMLLATFEGTGFIDEMRERSPATTGNRVLLARWRLASLLLAAGFDWQRHAALRRLSGVTPIDSVTLGPLLQKTGFRIETIEVLARHGAAERLIGVVARKA